MPQGEKFGVAAAGNPDDTLTPEELVEIERKVKVWREEILKIDTAAGSFLPENDVFFEPHNLLDTQAEEYRKSLIEARLKENAQLKEGRLARGLDGLAQLFRRGTRN